MLARERIAFASFHFQATEHAATEFTGGDYLNWVETTLGEIATITNIRIQAPDHYRSREMKLPSVDVLQRMEDENYFFPRLQFVTIEFEIRVPARFQSELDQAGRRLGSTTGELFGVTIRDGWKTSLAMVRPISEAGDPCDGVILVREFLLREFNRLGDRPIDFRFLGPSPAHIRISLEPVAGVHEYERVAHRRYGYDEYDFRCGDQYESNGQMCRSFFQKVSGELDILYRMTLARRRQSRLWREAVEDTDVILDAYKRTGVRGFFSRLLQGRRVRTALISLAEAELRQQEDKQEFDHAISSTYDFGFGLLPEAVRDELADLEPRAVEPLSSLLQLLDSSRQTHRDVAVASMATLFGAAVAAAAALIAAG